MWHDNETDFDLLGFHRFAKAIEELILDPDLLPITVGLFGDWGSGKSSLLRMIEKDLALRENVLCLRFDGWLFEGYDDAKAALMSTIVKGFRKNERLYPLVKNTLKRLSKRINWFRAMGLAGKGILHLAPQIIGLYTGTPAPLPSYLPTQAIQKSLDTKPDTKKDEKSSSTRKGKSLFDSVQDFRAEFAQLLEDTKLSSLVVLIDDLDRCLPPSIVSTLEAIKLFLSVPRTAFVVAADKRIVHHAVASRFSPQVYGDEDLPQQYLEKLVQVSVVLPILDPVEVEAYICLLFAQLKLEQSKFELLADKTAEKRVDPSVLLPINYPMTLELLGEDARNLEKEFHLAQTIAPVLADGLQGNPRQVKRFLNTLVLRLRMAKPLGLDIAPPVLAKLMVLERFHDDRYHEIYRWQSLQDGLPREIEKLEKAVESEQAMGGDHEDDGKSWLSDSSLVSWLRLEPALTGVNLSSYFSLTRETLTATSLVGRRLPEELQGILANLLSESQSTRRAAVKRLTSKTYPEADKLFEAVWARFLSAPTSQKRKSCLDALMEWGLAHESTASTLLKRLQKAPEVSISAATPLRVMQLGKKYSSVANECRALVQIWTSENRSARLRKAAEDALRRA
jgi:KAP family P-loop domain